MFLSNLQWQWQFNVSAARVAARLPPSNLFERFHFLTLDYRTPIIASILYVVIVSFFSRLNREKAAKAANVTKEGNAINVSNETGGKRTSARNKKTIQISESENRFTPFKCLVIAHNVFLCLYSATAFASVLPVLLRPYFSVPLLEAVRRSHTLL